MSTFGRTAPHKAWKLFYPGQTYTVYEGYDTENRLASLQYPSAQAVVYDRDGDGRITRIRLKTGTNTYTTIVDLVSYKPNGPIASLKYGDGYTETLTYDASYRLTGMLDANASVTLRNLSLAYDAKDNLTGVTDNLAAPNSEALTYSSRDMLASAAGAYGSLGWTYDGVGNRLSEVRNPGTGAVTDTYSYPATSNRLSSVATSGGGTRALGYDAAGNVITDNRSGQAYGYTYDNANRLASVTLNGVTQATYLYNYLGQQVIRTLTPSGTVIQSIYAPDGNRIAEYTSAGVLIRQYIWMDLKPVAIVEGGVVYYVRADHIGRPVFATTAAGTVVWKAAYKPFGGVSTTTGTPPDNRFPGQWFQTETGLYQNWMRNYDPATGRYIQADPLGLVDGASVYGYARQSPYMFTDPSGEFGWGGAAAGAIGGAISGGTAAYLGSHGCVTATVVGALAGGGTGAIAGGLTPLGASATSAAAAAIAQILANELACYCDQTRKPLVQLISSYPFWLQTIGAGVGAGVGSGPAEGAARGIGRRLFGPGPYFGGLSHAHYFERGIGELVSGVFSGAGEYAGSVVGGAIASHGK